MELAAALHHSRDGGRETYYGLRAPKTASSGGRRPGVLKEPEPPNVVERVLRHTMDQIVGAVPLLDDPVPQTVDTVLEFFRALDLPVVEQVIAVPRISTDRVSQRLVERRLPQMVEQLVHVPTVLSPLLIAEQIVGIPAPQRGGNWSLHGPLPGQSSTLSPSLKRISERIVEQTAVSSPVERIAERIVEQIAVSSPAERISKRTAEQIVDISPGDDRGQGSSSSAGPADEDFPGVFRTFPHGKKVRSAGQVSADLPRHVSSSTPAAQPVSDSWWASLTPSQKAELEEARAEVRREHGSKRKRKKRRKRRLPRSSVPRGGRARRRQRQLFACSAGFTGDDVPRVMFPSGVVWPKMLRIKAGMVQKDSCSGMAWLVLLLTVHLVLCFLPSFRPVMLGIMASMDQKASCWFLALLLALCSLLCLQAQDARLLGRQVQFLDKVFFMPFVVLRVVSWSRQCSIGGSAVTVHHGRVTPCCFAEADPHCPGCSDDHLLSTVAAL